MFRKIAALLTPKMSSATAQQNGSRPLGTEPSLTSTSLAAKEGLFRLPPEILQHVLSYLEAEDLIVLRSVSRDFKLYADLEQWWSGLIRSNVAPHDFPETPTPAPTYRELFLSHYPRWHLPKHKVWFSDDAYNGKLIIVKFDPLRGSIEGYRLVAEKPPAIPQIWPYRPSVIIHHFEPHVYASTEDPVLSIPLCLPHEAASHSRSRTLPNDDDVTRFPEIRMRVGRPEQRINASLMVSVDLPSETADTRSVSVWPPRTIPGMPRTRSSHTSRDMFSSKGHRPQSIEQISDTTFRLRTWSHFTQGMRSLGVRIGEEISTWSTLTPELYMPTPSRPYQGIFVGDYASHGCEFLLVMHSTEAPPYPRREVALALLTELRDQHFINDEDFAIMTEVATTQQAEKKDQTNEHVPSGQDVPPNVPDPDGSIHRGTLEAVKLTGDVNVPRFVNSSLPHSYTDELYRGEHSWIADDIGPDGTIRIAAERPFTGARVIKCRGHVAARGYRDGEFVPAPYRTILTFSKMSSSQASSF